MKTGSIIDNLRSKGYRITQIRHALVEMLDKDTHPLSAYEIMSGLEKQGIRLNKTTVYREISFLEDRQLIKLIDLGDGQRRYELITLPHHHHLICTKCGLVVKVTLHDGIDKNQAEICQSTRFVISDHILEFFGLCPNCQK